MPSGLFANRLIGLLLAVTMMWPTWMWGNCCCSRQAVLQTARRCCSAAVARPAAMKPCCAARRAITKVSTGSAELQPVSCCRCKTRVDSIAVSNLRGTELTTVISLLAIPDRITPVQQDRLLSVLMVRSQTPGDPPDPQDRCARLCRWLA
ncbi:MAG: hypothetical protein JSS49_14315 [Planctomycetes bacterium]|nr:hypothetical protein [Planctomycetota bacterium]